MRHFALLLLAVLACEPATTSAETPAPRATATAYEELERIERFGASVEVRRVWPRSTDPSIDSPIEPHLVAIAPDVPKLGTLFVYLPGTLGRADEARHLTELAAARGMHAVGLRYPNGVAVQQLCASDPDTTCFERVRAEVITGEDRHIGVTVSRSDGILNRVDKLVAYLAGQRPAEGWGSFLRDGRADWSRTIVAGTSQGGGMAAMIARDRVVERVVMLASPVESFVAQGTRRAAPWTYQPHATPADRYFAFGHVHDPFGIQVMRESWTALGLAGPAVDVDSSSPPYAGSHQLTTALSIAGVPAHPTPAMPVVDASGLLIFLRVWEYALGTAGG